jgi:hypothetical protein
MLVAADATRAPRLHALQLSVLSAADLKSIADHEQEVAVGEVVRIEPARGDPAEIEAGVLQMADDLWGWCEKRERLAAP